MERKDSEYLNAGESGSRRVAETGGSTTGDTFMFLIKVPLSRRRQVTTAQI